ncbi:MULTISPECIES: hypothetical protein [Novosphingobium]|uniref:hypothetical protein n=1 Tax=Novosphingobium TaxID=165696 RepID=UPI001CD53295|nr:hypothetical protein [Novosphingobium percolationis]MCH7629357.1 hypothetical protein [Pseudomonadota bacterium]
MMFKIRTPDGRLMLGTRFRRAARRPALRHPANDAALEEAAALLRQALSQLDSSGSFIAAAYVDQALSLLRLDRLVGEGG